MSNPMKAYQRVRITTASPAELVVLLFDGLAKFVSHAADALRDERFGDAGRSFERAQELIGHLRESLDERVSATFVASMDRTYLLWMKSLAKAQVERDADAVEAIGAQVLELAAAWRQAAEEVASSPSHGAGAR